VLLLDSILNLQKVFINSYIQNVFEIYIKNINIPTGPSLPPCLRDIPPLDTAAARLPEVSMAIAPTVSCICCDSSSESPLTSLSYH